MNYSLSFKPSRPSGIDADAKAYINAVKTAGATVNSTQRKAINDFVKSGKKNGWYSLLKRMYLPIWASAAPNAIDMIARGSGTFTGTLTHSSGFVTSNGTTGYFDVGQSLSAIGCALNSTSFGGLVTGSSATSPIRLLGVQDAANGTRSIISSSISTDWLVRVSVATSVNSATLTELRGVVLASRSSSTAVNVWQRTESGITRPINEVSSTSSTLNTTASVAFLANNNNGSVGTFAPATQQTGAMFIGTGFTNTQATDFTLALKTLWETCTGLTLP